jgi:hypothetical protein
MIELFQNARWQELYSFFTAGDPPMVFRLLAINTLFLVYFAIRKARSNVSRNSSGANIAQAILIAINFIVMFQPVFVPINQGFGNLL